MRNLEWVERFFEVMLFSILVVFLLALVGCQTVQLPGVETPQLVEEKIIVEEPRPALAWDGKHSEAGLWTEYVLQAIENSKLPTIVPKDTLDWCPAYSGQSASGRTEIWASLISKMAQYESGYKNSSTYTESFNDAKGHKVVSRGLLQISQESANGYSCGITDAQMLHDAKTNLTCAVKIIERWETRDGVISKYSEGWKGVARYWSVMRSKSQAYPKIKAYMNSLKKCQGGK
jgi:hypothetical protein